ncbi:hypothetical protein MVEN_01344100 [Mycena venus]|uniref:Maestro/Maestro-like HEAT-repeats domain-containing protein n=1 Tax=Mycena venus TaxID=2733690 RepID=A0A8H6XZC0_9AGAR|nr:hypothetical protein MVEN_01344100 [Mycena venus]
MLPLARQDTRPSIHSWWSDRNPGLWGPTINIHAMAKPLMRWMYHRQALQFIRENRDSPLSTETLEIYSSYFPLEYVFWSTKTAILSELAERASDIDNARIVADSPILKYIAHMLGSPDVEARNSSCRLLEGLVRHEYTIPAILGLNSCERLACLLRDEDSRVVYGAMVTLSRIACYVDGAQAIVDAETLDLVPELLKSPSLGMREWACELMNKIASHKSAITAAFVLQLVSLLSNEDYVVAEGAVEALTQLVRPVDGAQAILDAKALEHVLELLKSQSRAVRKRTCELVNNLTSYGSAITAAVVLQLVSLLSNKDSIVTEGAVEALTQIARPVDGAQAILDAKALEHVLELLKSPSPVIRKLTYKLVDNLASHRSATAAVIVHQLVSLLSNEDYGVIKRVVHALDKIAHSSDGAQAIVDAKALDLILELLETPSRNIRRWACGLVGNLACHESTIVAVLALKPFQTLVTLLSDEDSEVVDWAVYALSQIAHSSSQIAHPPDGAQAIVDAGALDHVLALLQSPKPNIRKCTCVLAGNLASHDSTRAAILALRPVQTLVSSLRRVKILGFDAVLTSNSNENNYDVIESAMYALSRIGFWLDGAEAIVDAKALNHIPELLDSPSPTIRKYTCELVGSIARHESTVLAVLELKTSERLLTLLWDNEVVGFAATALSQIARRPDGALVIVAATTLNQILLLLKSQILEVRNLLGELASHQSAVRAILKLKPCTRLVSLLREPATCPGAIFALRAISEWPDGVSALANTDIFWELQEFLVMSEDAQSQAQKD